MEKYMEKGNKKCLASRNKKISLRNLRDANAGLKTFLHICVHIKKYFENSLVLIIRTANSVTHEVRVFLLKNSNFCNTMFLYTYTNKSFTYLTYVYIYQETKEICEILANFCNWMVCLSVPLNRSFQNFKYYVLTFHICIYQKVEGMV